MTNYSLKHAVDEFINLIHIFKRQQRESILWGLIYRSTMIAKRYLSASARRTEIAEPIFW